MRLRVLLFLVLSSLLVGCEFFPHSVSHTNVRGEVTVEIWASSDNPQPGDVVVLRATVKNVGTQQVVTETTGHPVFDIVIYDQNTVTRLSDRQPATPSLMQLELGPGQSQSIEMNWLVPPSANGHAVGFHAILSYLDEQAAGPMDAGVLVPVGPRQLH